MSKPKACGISHATIPAPSLLRSTRFKVGTEDYAVLSYPLPRWSLPESLTPAERSVLAAILEGSDRAEVAALRGVSRHTVDNQLTLVFRKLGVRSREELAARLVDAVCVGSEVEP